MSSKRPKAKQEVKPVKSVKVKTTSSNSPLYDRINAFLNKYFNVFIAISLFIAALVSLLLFDVKVSLGGDDSAYISRAYNFFHNGDYPTFQGALYPIVLSIPVGLFGLKIIMLKMLSLIFILIHLYLFNRAIKDIISPVIRVFTILLIAINAYIAFFASSTYSEAFFMMMQSIFLLFFIKQFVVHPDHDKDNVVVKHFALLGLLIFLMTQTRFASLAVLGAVIVYFLAYKQWKKGLAAVISFAAFYIPNMLILKMLNIGKGMSSQMNTLLQVHPYDASKGQEDFMGFLMRIVDNSNLYIGKAFLVESGLRPALGAKVDGMLTIMVYLVLILGFVLAVRNKHKGVIFSYIYLGAYSIFTFLAIQKMWDQSRLIVVMYPFLWMLCLYPIYQLFTFPKTRVFQFAFLVAAGLFLMPSIARTNHRITDHSKVLQKNIAGDKLYGLTPDWVNYIKIVQWANKNLPKESVVACRKPDIAFIYTQGKNHYGIFKAEETNADSILVNLKRNGVTHVVQASLRKNPYVNDGQIINTVDRLLARAEQAYPGTFKFVTKEGTSEIANLYEINYYGIENK
jgi:hypothetical protein